MHKAAIALVYTNVF